MRSDLDFYFEHCPRFIKRMELLRDFTDKTEQNVAIFKFGKQFKLLDAHLPVISHYVKHGEYRPDLISSPIEVVDYSRGLVLNSNNPRLDFEKHYEEPPEQGLHIVISGDVNVEAVRKFIETNSAEIRKALNATDNSRIKRFTPITSLDKYILLADEYYFPNDKQKSHETIANDNNVSFSVASKWIKRLAPIMPPK